MAARYNLASHCLSPKDYPDFAAWDAALLALLRKGNPDFILLAGFLKKIGPGVLNVFQNRIVNTHPSLLPKYGGHGMFGRRVHEAVLKAKEPQTGVTIHLVNEKYDEGPILKQVTIPIHANETADRLEARVKEIEKSVLLEFLNQWKMNS